MKRYFCIMLSAIFLSTICLGSIVFADNVRKVDVWDFAGVEEKNTELYTNNITAEFWNNYSLLGSDGKFLDGKATIGDLILSHNSNDRLYSTLISKNAGSLNAIATSKYSDGYTASGMYYANGTGGDSRRNVIINNVVAGDKIVAYMGSSNAVDGTLHFTYMGTDGTQDVTETFNNAGVKYEFVAQYSGAYKLWTGGDAGKPIYNRVVRIPGVSVTGTIDLGGTNPSNYKVVFTNSVTGYETEATLDGNKFSVLLAAGDDYTVTLSGASGFGFTNETKKVKTEINDVLAGKKDVVLKVEAKEVYTYSGKLTGFAKDYDISKLKVTLAASKDSLADDVELSIGADGSYSVVLEPNIEYTAVLEGVNDYEVTEGKSIKVSKNMSSDIKVSQKPVYAISGGFLGLDKGVEVTNLKFTNVEDNYKYDGKVTSDGYTASLRDGAYSVSLTVKGYTTSTHIVVSGGAVKKDLLFISQSLPETKAWVSDIYVGYPDKGELNYATVNEAVAACEAMNPTSEEKRITVHIAPGTYREQIIINTPYISFVNDTDEEVVLTWYYGIGYKYYSADKNGYYNIENAYDKYEKRTVSKWGCATYLKSGAKGFKADGITFEASFNRYVTEEEVADGVEVSGGEAITLVRKVGTNVTTKSGTERSSAMAVEATNVEFTNCAFLGSQDTLYTGNSVNVYFKNCRIEGNTDYIFGAGNCVFDGCELKFYGYSGSGSGGHITAQRAGSNEYGYLFRNCVITGNSKQIVSEGDLGRPWGAGAKVTYLNTKIAGNLIASKGWSDMSGNKATNANFKEYNSIKLDGSEVNTSGRVVKTITEQEVAAVDVKKFFGNKVPDAYVEEDATVSFASAPKVTGLASVGNVLTVEYSLGTANDSNDASIIRWYSIDESGKETLVKSSSAIIDKTYEIPSSALGKQIKVMVFPETFSGNTADAVSYTLENKITEASAEKVTEAAKPTEVETKAEVKVTEATKATEKVTEVTTKATEQTTKTEVESSGNEDVEEVNSDNIEEANSGSTMVVIVVVVLLLMVVLVIVIMKKKGKENK